jgi:hypothetical protein
MGDRAFVAVVDRPSGRHAFGRACAVVVITISAAPGNWGGVVVSVVDQIDAAR